MPPALEARSLNHWTAREVPELHTLNGEIVWYVDYCVSIKPIKLKENKIAQPYHPNAASLCMSLPVCMYRHLYFYIVAIVTKF